MITIFWTSWERNCTENSKKNVHVAVVDPLPPCSVVLHGDLKCVGFVTGNNKDASDKDSILQRCDHHVV